jgi:hypothetical protein
MQRTTGFVPAAHSGAAAPAARPAARPGLVLRTASRIAASARVLAARRGLASRHAARRAASAHTLAAIGIVGVLATGCGSPGPSLTPTPAPSAAPTAVPSSLAGPTVAPAGPIPAASIDAVALYRQIEDDVIALRQLPAKQRLEPTLLDEAQARVRLEAQFRAENPPAEIAASQATLVAMGLLPAGTSLGDLYVDLLGSQVGGYYDPATKQIYVVARTGGIGATEEVFFVHEFTHALQDQNFGLEGIQTDAIGQGDRSMAHLALVEGDAYLLMTQWMTGHLDAAGIAEIMAGNPAAQAQLDATPPFLRDSLLLLPMQGTLFVASIWARGGWEAVDRAFGGLPDSTEQVLHADKYAADEQPMAVPLDAAAIAGRLGAGWQATPADTLGEFQVGSWLRARGVTGAGGGVSGDTAAAGWGGDRYALIEGPNRAYALVVLTTWDTPTDAAEFVTAAAEAVRGVPGETRVVRIAPGASTSAPGAASVTNAGGGDVAVLFASDAAILETLAAAALPANP